MRHFWIQNPLSIDHFFNDFHIFQPRIMKTGCGSNYTFSWMRRGWRAHSNYLHRPWSTLTFQCCKYNSSKLCHKFCHEKNVFLQGNKKQTSLFITINRLSLSSILILRINRVFGAPLYSSTGQDSRKTFRCDKPFISCIFSLDSSDKSGLWRSVV